MAIAFKMEKKQLSYTAITTVTYQWTWFNKWNGNQYKYIDRQLPQCHNIYKCTTLNVAMMGQKESHQNTALSGMTEEIRSLDRRYNAQFDLKVFGRDSRLGLLEVLWTAAAHPHLLKLMLQDLGTLLCHQASVLQADLTHSHIINTCTVHNINLNLRLTDWVRLNVPPNTL